MKKYLLPVLLSFGLFIGSFTNSQAQTLELISGNTLNGAMNGVLLGGATMALQNNQDFEPARVGLGAGILFGIGAGVYDVSQVQAGQQFYISGTFNDGTNSSILVLLDTIYGAAGGALIASATSLVIKKPLIDALQYGSGAGAWLGMGFGIIDAYVLTKGPGYYDGTASSLSQSDVSGLITYSNASKSVEIGMLNPGFLQQKKITKQAVKDSYTPTLDVINLQLDF